MVSLNENIAGVWELHPIVERSTLRRSLVNFPGTSFDSAALLRPPFSDVASTGAKRTRRERSGGDSMIDKRIHIGLAKILLCGENDQI